MNDDKLAHTGANAAGNTVSSTKQPPPVDIALKLRVDDGMAIVTWNPKAVADTPCQLVIGGPVIENESPIPLTTVVTGSHQWKVASSGTFTAEIKSISPSDATAPPAAIHETKTFVLSKPPALKLKSIVVDRARAADDSTSDKSSGFTLAVTIAQPPNLAQYGPKDQCRYVVHGHSDANADLERSSAFVGRVSASGEKFSLSLPTEDWQIDRIRHTTFTVTVETPQGTAAPTTEGGMQPDITGIVRRGWDTARERRIWPIRPPNNGTAADLMQLPPGVVAGDIDLVLLTPTNVIATLSKQPDREAWACSVGVAEQPKADQKPTDATKTEPAPLAEVGHFEIQPPKNADGWPTLTFHPSDHGDGHDNNTDLQLLEMCKLCVTEAAPQHKPRKALVIAQLLAPAKADMVDAEKAKNKTPEEMASLDEQLLRADLLSGKFAPSLKLRATPNLFWLAQDKGMAGQLRLTFTTDKSPATKADSPWLELECRKIANGKPCWLLWITREKCRIAFSQPTLVLDDATITPGFMYWWPYGLFQHLGHTLDTETPDTNAPTRGTTIHRIKPVELSEQVTQKAFGPKGRHQPEEMGDAGFSRLQLPKMSHPSHYLNGVVTMPMHNIACPALNLPADVQRRITTCVQKAIEKNSSIHDYRKAIQDARVGAIEELTKSDKKMTEDESSAWDAIENRAAAINKRFAEIETFVKSTLPTLSFHLDTISWRVSLPDAESMADVEAAGGLEVIGVQRVKITP
jgi:hypothetical protein